MAVTCCTQVKEAHNSKLKADNPQRFHDLDWVLAMTIGSFSAFALVEDDDVRLMRQNHHGLPDPIHSNAFRADRLHNQKVKHHLVEVYTTHKRRQFQELALLRKISPLPSISLQLDFCKSQISGDQYLGTH